MRAAALPAVAPATKLAAVAAAAAGQARAPSPPSALPAKFFALTDAGCGNWSVTQLRFWAFLVAAGIIEEAEWWRLPVGHTHRKADAIIAAFARAHKAQRKGRYAPTDGGTEHEKQQGSPQNFLRSMPYVFNSADAWATSPERLVDTVERATVQRGAAAQASSQ